MINLSSDSFPRDVAAMTAFRNALPRGIRPACLAGQIAYRSVQIHGTDVGRAVRAAALAVSGERRPYKTTREACSCLDAWYHPGRVCKHRLALRLGLTQVSRT